MKPFIGIEYGRAATATITNAGPAHGPSAIRAMFPHAPWTRVQPDEFNMAECMADRFGENAKIQAKIYSAIPTESHIMIGGDHSTNFGHMAAIADQFADQDICLVYIDAHLDIHTPESSRAEASGAPHGTNVRALLGNGDARWIALQKKSPALRPENLFYIGIRSFEPSEIEYAKSQNIYIRTPRDIDTPEKLQTVIDDVRGKIGNRRFVVSFDFDAIDPTHFCDILVPEPNGISPDTARALVRAFSDAYSFEFVEYSPTSDTSSAALARELIELAQ